MFKQSSWTLLLNNSYFLTDGSEPVMDSMESAFFSLSVDMEQNPIIINSHVQCEQGSLLSQALTQVSDSFATALYFCVLTCVCTEKHLQ